MVVMKLLRNGLILGITMLVAGCAWYEGLEWTYQERAQGIPKRNLSRQDPELEKFYELQKRIDELEARLERKEASQPARSHHGRVAPQGGALPASPSAAESAIAYVKERTRAAIALIDSLLAQMDKPDPAAPSAPVAESPGPEPEPEPQQLARVDDAAIAGTLERNDEGAVVSSTSDGNRYNYSVVYVYPETKPWFDMWALLSENGVQDKWRGQNPEKQTYFIYVGAYYTESPARKRSENLLTLTGTRPQIRVRQGYQSVAMQ